MLVLFCSDITELVEPIALVSIVQTVDVASFLPLMLRHIYTTIKMKLVKDINI
jgi:hypothetical protein